MQRASGSTNTYIKTGTQLSMDEQAKKLLHMARDDAFANTDKSIDHVFVLRSQVAWWESPKVLSLVPV